MPTDHAPTLPLPQEPPPRHPFASGQVIGTRAKWLRRGAHLTMRTLGAKARVSSGLINDLEHGGAMSIPLGRFLSVCHALGIHPSQLLDPKS